MKTEVCQNCSRIIGNLETRFLFNKQIVCNKCDEVLRNLDKIHKDKERTIRWNRVGIAVTGTIVLASSFILIGAVGNCNRTLTRDLARIDDDARDADLSIQAYRVAKEYVTEQLKCPATAKFPWFADDLSQFKNQIYVMRSYVDSENSFGAMIRTHFVIEIQFMRNHNTSQWDWTVLLFETT